MLIEIFFRGPVKADAKADGKTDSPPRQDWSIKEAGVKGTECSLNIVFFFKDFSRVSDPHFFLRIRIRAKIFMRIRIRILGVSGEGAGGKGKK